VAFAALQSMRAVSAVVSGGIQRAWFVRVQQDGHRSRGRNPGKQGKFCIEEQMLISSEV
jgi:hypothetical protein